MTAGSFASMFPRKASKMKYILIISWFTLSPGGPQGTASFPFPTVEHCRGAAMFAAVLIEKIPTAEKVKFVAECKLQGQGI